MRKPLKGKPPRHTGSRAGREQWLCIVNLRCRRTARMGGGSHDLYYLHRPRRTRALRLSMRLRPVHRRGGPEEVSAPTPARSRSGSWASRAPRRSTRAARRASPCAASCARWASTASWAPSRRCRSRRPRRGARTTGATPPSWRACSPRGTSPRCGCRPSRRRPPATCRAR